jgi:hypothetical protein
MRKAADILAAEAPVLGRSLAEDEQRSRRAEQRDLERADAEFRGGGAKRLEAVHDFLLRFSIGFGRCRNRRTNTYRILEKSARDCRFFI